MTSRLIETFELPKTFLADDTTHSNQDHDHYEDETLKPRKAKAHVVYDDGLTEDQFLKYIEQGKDLNEVIQSRSQKKHLKRTESDHQDSKKQIKKSNKSKQLSHDSPQHLTIEDTPPHSIDSSPPSDKRTKSNEIFLQRQLNHLLDAISNQLNEGGIQRCHLFLNLPSKRAYPDYYTTIDNPISLNQIRSKINADQYDSMVQFKNDMDLMFSNALQYNMEGSEVYDDAIYLKSVLDGEFEELAKETHKSKKSKMDADLSSTYDDEMSETSPMVKIFH
jgi:ATP-dependent helicase STH1/SNF2